MKNINKFLIESFALTLGIIETTGMPIDEKDKKLIDYFDYKKKTSDKEKSLFDAYGRPYQKIN